MSITYKNLSGPKQLPLLGNIHQVTISNLHNNFEKWASEYGDVFKVALGPKKFTIVSKPEIVQQILKQRPTKFRRMSKLDHILRSENIIGVFNTEGEEWKIHRKIVNKGLDLKHQQLYFPSMLVTLERFYNKMIAASQTNESYIIQDDLIRFTVDVTSFLAFGYEMNTLEQKGGVIQNYMEKIFPMLFKRINDPILFYKIYKNKKDREYDVALREINKQIDVFIENGKERLKKNPELKNNPSNFLEAILVAAEEEHVFSNQEIKGNLLTILLAGEDTTAHSIAWAISFICKHPEVQKKLQEEADAVLGQDNYLKEYSKHNDFPYIEAVINETLRLKSVAPLLIMEPLEDVEIDNYLFKKGAVTTLLTRFGATSDHYFSDSDQFKPERWLEKAASACPVHNTDALMPFGFGPRFCPGKNLAFLEMKLVLSMIAKNFTIEMVSPPEEVKEIMAFAMMPSKYEIGLKKRN
jgi:cytochrome P450